MLNLMKGLLGVSPGDGRDDPPAVSAVPAGLVPKSDGSEPIVPTPAAPGAPDAGTSPAKAESKSGESSAPTGPEGMKVPITGHGVAVLTLSEVGEILSAQGCTSVFGCEGPALVGQSIHILLKGGLDNEVGRFLHRQHAGKNITGSSLLRVIALRKDGTEFPASITTVVLKSDTTLKLKSDASRFWWTAFIRDMATVAEGGIQVAKLQGQENGPFAADFFRLQESHSALEKANEELQRQLQDASAAGVRQEETGDGKATAISEDGKAALEQAEAALQQQREKAERLEQELTSLRSGQVGEPGQAPAGSAERVALLESQLRYALDELETVKAAALERSQSPAIQEFELRAQLDSAREAAGFAEAALNEELARSAKLEERLQNLGESLKVEQMERSKRFDAELCALRQERDELNSKLAVEQQAAAESARSAGELETRLARNAAEVERAKAELGQLTSERDKSESAWREQLDTAFIKKKEVEGAWAGALERNKHFEHELAKLREERDLLSGKLTSEQQAATESKRRAKEVETRLGRNANEFDRAQGELEKQGAERTKAEAQWREELAAAQARKKKLEIDWTEAVERNQRLEAELTALRAQSDGVNRKLLAEQKAAAESKRRADELQSRLGLSADELQRVQAELDKRTADLERAESSWREPLDAAKAQKKEMEVSWAEVVERNMQFEEELTRLRREREELEGRLTAEQQAATGPARRAEELERRLGQATGELARAKAETQKLNAGHERAESEWREQLETAKALAKKLEGAWATAVERSKRSEEELAALRQERNGAEAKRKTEQSAAAKPGRRAAELETRVGQYSAEVSQLKAELAALKADRQRSESDLRRQLEETAKAARAPKPVTPKKPEPVTTATVPLSAPPLGPMSGPTPASAEHNQRFDEELRQAKPIAERYKLAP